MRLCSGFAWGGKDAFDAICLGVGVGTRGLGYSVVLGCGFLFGVCVVGVRGTGELCRCPSRSICCKELGLVLTNVAKFLEGIVCGRYKV